MTGEEQDDGLDHLITYFKQREMSEKIVPLNLIELVACTKALVEINA